MRSAARLLGFLALLVAVTTRAAEPPALPIADFEDGVQHFDDAGEHDATTAAAGAGSLRLEHDFAADPKQKWVGTGRYLRLRHRGALAAITLQVRSQTVTQVNVQIVDATGQTHQLRLPVQADDQWRPLRVTGFGGGEHWDGANDGVFHWPARAIRFVVEAGSVREGGVARIWLDQVAAVPADAP